MVIERLTSQHASICIIHMSTHECPIIEEVQTMTRRFCVKTRRLKDDTIVRAIQHDETDRPILSQALARYCAEKKIAPMTGMLSDGTLGTTLNAGTVYAALRASGVPVSDVLIDDTLTTGE